VRLADGRRRHDAVPCPDPLHAASKVKSVDTRHASSGLRRDYLCRPTVGKRHKFTALIEVEDEPVPLYVPPPKCPVHGAQGRRVRNGTYGTPGEPMRRQRYRCWPDKPDPDFPKGFHNFTPPLAREHVHTGESHCQACEVADPQPPAPATYSSLRDRELPNQLDSRGATDDLAALADRLGLVEPRLVHRRARAVAGTGDLPTAIALLDTGLAARDGSSDRAWADLTAYRDALAARQAAADRGRPARAHRRGHSAPTARPSRRRFTATHNT
jgi:hypothetical protein